MVEMMKGQTDFTRDQNEVAFNQSTDQRSQLLQTQQGYQHIDGITSQVPGNSHPGNPQYGHQHGNGTAMLDQPYRPLLSRQTNSRPGSSMRPGSRGMRSTMSKLSRSRISRCSTAGSNRQRRHHLIVEALDGTKLAISYAWLSEWLSDVASMSAGLRNKQVNTILAGLPENILDVNPHTISDLLHCLPAREAMRFKSMAVTTANYGTTTVTALDHTYIDFAIDHTFQRIEAQMQGLWAPSPEPGQQAGGHDMEGAHDTAPQQPVFMFLLEQFDAQVEAAIKIQESQLIKEQLAATRIGTKAKLRQWCLCSVSDDDHRDLHIAAQRAFRQYRDRKGTTKQSTHEDTHTTKARYLDYRKDQHGAPLSREMDELKQIFHNKLMDRMRSRASSRAGQDGRPAMTEEEMSAIAERQAVKLVKQAARDKRAAERLAERETRTKARELAKDARREARILKKLQGREVRLLGKLGRAKIRRVVSLKKQLEGAESRNVQPTETAAAGTSMVPVAVLQTDGITASGHQRLPGTEGLGASKTVETESTTVGGSNAHMHVAACAAQDELSGSSNSAVIELTHDGDSDYLQIGDALHANGHDIAVCKDADESGVQGEGAQASQSDLLSQTHQHAMIPPDKDRAESVGSHQPTAVGNDNAVSTSQSQQAAVPNPAGPAVAVPAMSTGASDISTAELQSRLAQVQDITNAWMPLTFQALKDLSSDQATFLLDQLAAQTKQQLKDLKSRKLTHSASKHRIHLSINRSRQYRGSLTGSKAVNKREPWALTTPRGTTPTSRGPSMSGNVRVSFVGNEAPQMAVSLTPRHRLAASTLSKHFSQQIRHGEAGGPHSGEAETTYQETVQNVAQLEEKLIAIKHALTVFQGYVSSGAEDSGDDDVLSSQESSLSGSSGSHGSSSDDDDSSITSWSLSDISDIHAADMDRGKHHQTNNSRSNEMSARSPSPESGSVITVAGGRPASSDSIGNIEGLRSSLTSSEPQMPATGLQGTTLRTANPLKKAVFAGQSMQNEEHFYNLQRKAKKPPPLRLASVSGFAGKQSFFTDNATIGDAGPDMTSFDSTVNSPGRMQALIINKLNQGLELAESSPALDNEPSADQLSGGLNSLDLTSGPHSSLVAFKSGLNLLHHMMFKDGLEVMEAVSKADTPEKMKEVLRAQVQQLVEERLLQIRHSLSLSAAKRASCHGSAKPSPRSRSHSRAPSCAGSRSNTIARRSRCGRNDEHFGPEMLCDSSPTGLLDRIADPYANVDLSPSDKGGLQHTVFHTDDQEFLKNLITETLAEQLANELSTKKTSIDGSGALGPVLGLQADASVEQIEAHIKDALQDKAAVAASKLAIQRRRELAARRKAQAKTRKAARVAAIGNDVSPKGNMDDRCSSGNWAVKGTLMSSAVPRSPGSSSISPSWQRPSRRSLLGENALQKTKHQAAAMAAHLSKLQQQAQRLAAKPAGNPSTSDDASEVQSGMEMTEKPSPESRGTPKQRCSVTCIVTVGDELVESENRALRASEADTAVWTPRRSDLSCLQMSPRAVPSTSSPQGGIDSIMPPMLEIHEPVQPPQLLDLPRLDSSVNTTCSDETPTTIDKQTVSAGDTRKYDAARARRMFLRHARNNMSLSSGHVPQISSMGEAADYLAAAELHQARSLCLASCDAWAGFDMSQSCPSWSTAYIQSGTHALLDAARDSLQSKLHPAPGGEDTDHVQRVTASITSSVRHDLDQLPSIPAASSPSTLSRSDFMRPMSRGLHFEQPITPSRLPSPVPGNIPGERQGTDEMAPSYQITLPEIRSPRSDLQKSHPGKSHRKPRRTRTKPKDSSAITDWINEAESVQAGRLHRGQLSGDTGHVRTGHSVCKHAQALHRSTHATAAVPGYHQQSGAADAVSSLQMSTAGCVGMTNQDRTELDVFWSQKIQLPGLFAQPTRNNLQTVNPCKEILWLYHTHGKMISALAKDAVQKMPIVPH